MATAANTRQHRKRHGHHQKRSKHFLRTYAPYLPLTLIVLSNIFVGWRWHQPSQPSVLAYATEMSIPNLLSATNSARGSNGVGSLGVDSRLNQAAQAKAADMVNRNYWSHNTPEGNPPWTFIINAGYSYSRAGENLAYGFATSSDTVDGWMNSPSHRENILSSGYTQVGFGIVNAPNFNNSGQQTLVVAMYAAPYNAPKPTTKSAPASNSQSATRQSAGGVQTPAATNSRTVEITVTDEDGQPLSGIKVTLRSEPQEAVTNSKGVATFTNVPLGEHTATIETENGKVVKSVKVDGGTTEPLKLTLKQPLPANQTSAEDFSDPKSQSPQTVSRMQVLTRGSTPWIMSAVILGALTASVYLIFKHSVELHRLLVRGEKYVMKHMLLDVTVVSFLLLCYMVSRGAGVIL